MTVTTTPRDTVSLGEILEKALDGERLSDEDAIALLRSRDLVAVGRAANEIRNRLTDPAKVTFIVDRNLNYTNVCVTDCDFCAFYRRPGDQRVLELREPLRKRLGRGPNREDHGQARSLEPEPPEVEVRRGILERALECGIADQERCIRIHSQREDLRLREQDADEDDRGRALRCDRDRSDLTEGHSLSLIHI